MLTYAASLPKIDIMLQVATHVHRAMVAIVLGHLVTRYISNLRELCE